MPLIEVEDSVIAALAQNGIQYTDAKGKITKAAEIEAAFAKLTSGPQRTQFLKLYKEAYPDAVVPELDAAKPVMDEMSALRKEFTDFVESTKKKEEDQVKASRESAASRTVSDGRGWLRRDKKLDDEGVTAVEKVMQDLGVPNYEVAFNHWKASQPPDAQTFDTNYGGRNLDWFKEDDRPDVQLLMKDPLAFRRKETGKVLQEIREGRLNAA